ncbi:hypothetical protein SLEP1_g453 [Rubroshorea leprosula]|uniref:Uncharacterized protein n=1 Tax=Rubroshorea leprosula TaxID=152421 RepID=A0AAV5HJX9_9ROSI|nr:hypothetical protein SLEP1_g453 [Rubroshorea leprosula]
MFYLIFSPNNPSHRDTANNFKTTSVCKKTRLASFSSATAELLIPCASKSGNFLSTLDLIYLMMVMLMELVISVWLVGRLSERKGGESHDAIWVKLLS